jgi:hypothetical protein
MTCRWLTLPQLIPSGFYSRVKLYAMDCATVKVIVHGGLLIL